MTDETFQLQDIPDLSGVMEDKPEPWSDGWYEGTILEQRAFTDSNGNDRVFASSDEPAQKSGRNIRLQVVLTRQSDGRTLNTNTLVNYQPDDLTQESVQQVMAHKDKVKAGEQWGSMFRAFAALNRIGTLQRIAGVRAFGRNGNGGLDLHPLFGKRIYARLTDDERNPQYKAIKEFRSDAPKKVL
jgi:hypothetical protein